MNGESNTEIYNTICKIGSQWEFAQGTQTRAEGGGGEGDGREGTWVYLF